MTIKGKSDGPKPLGSVLNEAMLKARVAEESKRKFKEATPLATLMSMEFPDEEWVVDGLVPEGFTIVSAQPASFKTWLLLSIASSVAKGDLFAGEFGTSPKSVLMIDEENSARLLQKRLQLLQAEGDLPVYFMIEQDFKLEDDFIDQVIEVCQDKGIGLVTFDSLVRIHNENENDAVRMAEVAAKIRRFTKENISVIVTHHNRKNNGDGGPGQEMRGSSDILAAVDCHISVSRDGRTLTLTQSKLRHAEERNPVQIEVIEADGAIVLQYAGSVTARLDKATVVKETIVEILFAEEELNQGQLLERLEGRDMKVNPGTLRAYINKMIGDGVLKVKNGEKNEKLYSLSNDTEKPVSDVNS